MRTYAVYILASRSRRIYVGVTGNLTSRLLAHRNGCSAFTAKYLINRLVFVETTTDVRAAIRREKQIKGWTRAKKVALIESMNPTWEDLSVAWNLLPASLSSSTSLSS